MKPRAWNRRTRMAWSIALVLLAFGWCGCAARSRGVPIDARPTPGASSGTAPRADGTAATERRAQRVRVVADTSSARATASRCLRATLLPEQEASLETLRELLRRTRVALLGEDLARAESLARQARQVASALDCGD